MRKQSNNMGGYAWLMVGNMITKIFGEYIQGGLEKHFPKLAETRRRVQAEKRAAEVDAKILVSNHEHKQELEKLKVKFENDLKLACRKIVNQQEVDKYKEFLKTCFPLRNPYDIAIPFSFYEGEDFDYSLATIANAEGVPVVPIRLILAMSDTTPVIASDIGSELSIFLVNHYSSSSINAVISDIGSWKPEIPVNDASINYLYKGLQGQPTVVIVPEFMDNDKTLKLKIWSWTLGEQNTYPSGFYYGYLDLERLSQEIWCDEIKEYAKTLKKTGFKDKQVDEAMVKINTMEDPSYGLTPMDKQRLMSQIVIPDAVQKFNNHRKRVRATLGTFFSLISAIYTDAYHLRTSGVMPLFPHIAHNLPGIQMFATDILEHYLQILLHAHHQKIVSTEKGADFILTLITCLRTINASETEIINPLIKLYKTEFFYSLITDPSSSEDSKRAIKRLNARANELSIN